MKKCIVTVLGKDTVGIVAKVCTYLAENKINVLDISQTIIQGYFNMMVIVDVTELPKDFTQMCDEMEKLGDEIGVSIRCQREDILKNAQIIREEFIRRHRIERINNMINMYEVSETNEMIEHENLDVRTITLGISLLDCIDSDLEELNRKIYDKITETAKDLVSVGRDIEKEFGIPIVNKRISVTPIALVGGAACKSPEDFVTIAKRWIEQQISRVNFIGGYSALVSKGMTKSDENLIRSIPQALAQTERICSSVNVGSTKTGINMDAVRLCGEIVKATAEETKERDSLGCAKLVIFCNAPDDNPFMAGAFLGVTESDAVINVGVSGPGVVKKALEKVRGKGFEELCETIKKTAFKVTRVGQLVAGEASQRLGIPFGIVDLSLAPTPAIGDSVAEILEEIGLERVGAPGTTAALAMLNDQVKKGGVMASSYVGGLSGAFIPVSEDQA